MNYPCRGLKRGQAITEFVLMLATVLTVLLALQFGFQRIAYGLWKQMTCDVSAPCVMCRPDPGVAGSSKSRVSCRTD